MYFVLGDVMASFALLLVVVLLIFVQVSHLIEDNYKHRH
jgi:hypothetical protein